MKIGNFLFQRLMNKDSFHIPNKLWLKNLIKKLFTVRVFRGRGKRTEVAKKLGLHPRRFDDVLPLKYATSLHVYLPYRRNQ